jgi:folate-dependent phosphoribosylglycinamide formyltransferase PurN
MNDKPLRIVMLCGKGRSSRIMFHGLSPGICIVGVIMEGKSSFKMLIRRCKKLGIVTVFGQLLFLAYNRLLHQMSHTRIKQLFDDIQLNDAAIPGDILQTVDSINSEEAILLLQNYNPDAVVVNGTRIISAKMLSAVEAPFINTHSGITPRYRGVHGGYWAMANEDPTNCGVTVHLVDTGIDTGGVLYQALIFPDHRDNFATYPIHQIAKAIPLMRAALQDVGENRMKVRQGVLPSQLWYHPTLFTYFKNWIIKGVK